MSAVGSTKQGINVQSGGGAVIPRLPAAFVIPTLAVALVIVVILSIGIGAVPIRPSQTLAIIASHLGFETDVAFTQQQDAVVWAIRLPRVLLAVLVGAALAVGGAALQAIFRNPLADPGLIGVSSGAAFGAVLAASLGLSFLGIATLPFMAFVCAVLTALLVYALARHQGRTEVVTLVLVGIAINTIAGAGTGLLTYVASDQALRAVIFWSLGSLGGTTWRIVLATTPFVLAGVLLVPRWQQSLNLFVLGEREARHLGVDTERVRFELIVLTALMTGAAVAAAGIIGFVGLIVPHLIRLIAGPDHRTLLPAAALGGALLVVLSDLLARTIIAPVELPLGVLTALMGGPFMLFLMLRIRRSRGGWG